MASHTCQELYFSLKMGSIMITLRFFPYSNISNLFFEYHCLLSSLLMNIRRNRLIILGQDSMSLGPTPRWVEVLDFLIIIWLFNKIIRCCVNKQPEWLIIFASQSEGRSIWSRDGLEWFFVDILIIIVHWVIKLLKLLIRIINDTGTILILSAC